MPDYRRLRIAGGLYFFTVNLADRRSCLLTDRVDDLRQAVRRVRALAPSTSTPGWCLPTTGPMEASPSRSRTRRVLAAYRIGGAVGVVGRQSASHPT